VPEVTLLRLFEHLDQHGIDGAIAEVELQLRSGQHMTVGAGGPGVHCAPDFPPFDTYEVVLDHDPPRFWSRYTDDVGLVFANVPRLLISHHITRSGGVLEASRTVRRAKVASPDQMVLVSVPGALMGKVQRMLRQIEGVEVISTSEPH
jgi:hypothetical protein